MDEQMTQQATQVTSSTWDATADGAAYQVSEEASSTQPEQSEGNAEALQPDGIALDDEGKIQVGEEFFSKPEHEEKKEPTDNLQQPPEPNTPNYYTDDELKTMPFETWDLSRLNGDIQKFAPIVRDQLQQRSVQQKAQTIENIPMPDFISEPKQYTAKELSEASKKLACERLGLSDPEEFDPYETEHKAAMELAMQELTHKYWEDLQSYQRSKSEWDENLRFQAELARRPDFNEFNQWYMGNLKAAGATAEQMNAKLLEYVRENGNRFSLIPQLIGSWYKEFLTERGRMTPKPKQTAPKTQSPPVLESTRGNNYEERQRINMRDFRRMDADEQAEALIRLGLVD